MPKGFNTLLVDGHNLAYKCWFSNLSAPQYFEENFLSRLLDLVREYCPAQPVIAWDGRSARIRKIFPTYKTVEDPAKQEVKQRIQKLREVLSTIAPTLYSPHTEADEEIANFVRESEDKNASVLVVSTDKDMHQLVSHRVFITDKYAEVKGLDFVREEWGLEPFQIPIVRAVEGDKSDGLGGVPRIRKVPLRSLAEDCLSVDSFYTYLKAGKDLAFSANEKTKLLENEDLVRANYAIMNIRGLNDAPNWYGPKEKNMKKVEEFCSLWTLRSMLDRKEWYLFQM